MLMGLNTPPNGWLIEASAVAPLAGTKGGDIKMPVECSVTADGGNVAVVGSQIGISPSTTLVHGEIVITFGQLYTLHGVQLSGTSGDLEITTRGADNTPKTFKSGAAAILNFSPPEPVQSVSFSKGAVGILRVSIATYVPPTTVIGAVTPAPADATTLPPTVTETGTLAESSTTKFDVVMFVQTETGTYIAAGVGGGLLLLIIAAILICWCLVRRGRSRGAKSIPEAIMVSIRRSDYQPTLFPTVMDSADDGLEMQKSPRAIAKQYSAFNVQDGRVTLPPPPAATMAPLETSASEYDAAYHALPTQSDLANDDDSRPYAFKPGRKSTEAAF
jgi:hypothetical protein